MYECDTSPSGKPCIIEARRSPWNTRRYRARSDARADKRLAPPWCYPPSDRRCRGRTSRQGAAADKALHLRASEQLLCLARPAGLRTPTFLPHSPPPDRLILGRPRVDPQSPKTRRTTIVAVACRRRRGIVIATPARLPDRLLHVSNVCHATIFDTVVATQKMNHPTKRRAVRWSTASRNGRPARKGSRGDQTGRIQRLMTTPPIASANSNEAGPCKSA